MYAWSIFNLIESRDLFSVAIFFCIFKASLYNSKD